MAAAQSVEIEFHPPTLCIVKLSGEHDVSSTETVELALAAAHVYPCVIADLAQCTFLDCTVINVLVLASKRARESGGALELVVPVERNVVRRALEIANVQMFLPFHETRVGCLASVSSAALRRTPHEAPQRHGTVVVRAQVSDVPARRAVTPLRPRKAA